MNFLLVNDLLAHRWGSLFICIVAILVTLLFKAVEHYRFLRHMNGIRFPSAHSGSLWTPVRTVRKHIHYRRIAATWFISRFNTGLLIFSFVALLLGVWRAILLAMPTEFQRLGAIIVAVGLFSIMNGMREERMLKDRWEDIEENSNRPSFKPVANVIDLPIEHAARKATLFSVLLSLIGTLVWAYGDQVLGCGVFSLFGLDTASSCDLGG